MVVEAQSGRRTATSSDRAAFLENLAWMVKSRWDAKLGTSLAFAVDRTMVGPRGSHYTADIVLEDPDGHWPRVCFGVMTSPSRGPVQEQLRRLLGTRDFLAREHEPKAEVWVLAPERLLVPANLARAATGADGVEVW